MLKKTKLVRPTVSREDYLLRNIERAFPGGEWVDEPQEREGEAEVAEVPGCEPGGRGFESLTPPHSVAIIGGTKYDAKSVQDYLAGLPEGTTVYVGAGRGVESDLRNADDCPLPVQVVDLDPDRYGRKARDVNVPEVLIQDISSPVVLVGAGTRVTQARSWLRMVNDHRDAKNRREVVEL